VRYNKGVADMKKIALADIQINYPSAKLASMTKEEKIAEVEFLEECYREMPSQQTAYDIEVVKLNLYVQHGYSGHDSMVGLMRDLTATLKRM
jgi:hypothetical protein